MKRREELLRKAQQNPVAFVQERIGLEEQVQQQTRTVAAQKQTLAEQAQRIAQQIQTMAQQAQRIAGQMQTISEQAQKIAEQNSLIAQLQRLLFGPRSEKLDAEKEAQLADVASDLQAQAQRPTPDSDEVLEAEEPDPKKENKQQRRRGGRHPMPVHLEVQTTVLEPADAQCEHCGALGDKIGEDVSEQIDLIAARLVVRRTVRIKRRCRCGCGQIAIAPLPAQLIPGSKLAVGLAVFILLSKYDDHLALYTLERIFQERHGVLIPRQQMVQWIEPIAGLPRLIVDRMWQRMKQGDYLQIDETPVRVLDPEVKGKAAQGYLWFFGVPGGDVVLVFDPRRSYQVLEEQLKGFAGAFQSDAYQVYEVLKRKRPGIKRLGCAAHSRRKFYEAALEGNRSAIWFIGRFRELYEIEDEVREATPEQRQAIRQARAPQIWAEMKARAEELKPALLPKSSLGKAVNYFLNEYEVLLVYLESPHFQIDNNLIENAIRPSCVGKKRWLFIGHPDAGWRSAVIYSILQSCRRRGIEAQEYLTDVLTRLPGMKNTEIDQLLPENWQAARGQRPEKISGPGEQSDQAHKHARLPA